MTTSGSSSSSCSLCRRVVLYHASTDRGLSACSAAELTPWLLVVVNDQECCLLVLNICLVYDHDDRYVCCETNYRGVMTGVAVEQPIPGASPSDRRVMIAVCVLPFCVLAINAFPIR